jgi:hypothetical protein
MDVPQDQIDHHLRVKLIAPIDAPAEPAAESRKAVAGVEMPGQPT